MSTETDVKNPYTVKNVKSFTGREGLGYEATLYKDGKRIGIVTDVCDGSGMVQCYLNDGEEEKLEAFVDTLPARQCKLPTTPPKRDGSDADELEYEECSFPETVCSFLASIVDEFELNARLKKDCKTKTVISLHSEKDGVFVTYKVKFFQSIKKQLQDRYGEDLKEIINERFDNSQRKRKEVI